jgi:hypothetical protein
MKPTESLIEHIERLKEQIESLNFSAKRQRKAFYKLIDRLEASLEWLE